MPNINVLVPLKIRSEKQYLLFKQCVQSYEHLFDKERISFKVADDSLSPYASNVKEQFESYGCEIEYIASNGYVDAVRNLFRVADQKYIFWIFDDVQLLTKKDIISPCIRALEDNQNLIQIKLGGGKCARKNKLQNTALYGASYVQKTYGNDIVWSNKIGADTENFIISQWNAVLRTDIFKEINKDIKTSFSHWDDYLMHIKANYMHILKERESGWLNFEDHLHPWGRSDISLEQALSLL